MSKSIVFPLVLASTLNMTGCGSDSTSVTAAFPDVSALAAQVVPQIGSGSRSSLRASSSSLDLGLLSSRTVTYATSGDYTSGSIGSLAQEVFGPVGGPVTRVLEQMASLQSQVEEINSGYVAADGSPTNCTQVIDKAFGGDSDGITVPFFDSADAIFWTDNISVVPRATCYVHQTAGGYERGFVFGRTAITAPTSGCTDPYVYVVINGYSSENGTNATDVANRGTRVDGFSFQIFYYNGCSKDVGIAMALNTKYPNATGNTNDEFAGRFELWGNAETHVFDLRVNKLDAYNGGTAGFNSFYASGKGAGSSGNFIMGITPYTCSSTGCSGATAGTAQNYCMALGSTAGEVSVDSTTANCADYETSFTTRVSEKFTDGTTTGLPRAFVSFSAATVFGL